MARFAMSLVILGLAATALAQEATQEGSAATDDVQGRTFGYNRPYGGYGGYGSYYNRPNYGGYSGYNNYGYNNYGYNNYAYSGYNNYGYDNYGYGSYYNRPAYGNYYGGGFGVGFRSGDAADSTVGVDAAAAVTAQ